MTSESLAPKSLWIFNASSTSTALAHETSAVSRRRWDLAMFESAAMLGRLRCESAGDVGKSRE